METYPCIFCKIAAGSAPAKIVYQDAEITAFYDRHPRAPVHVLIIPNRHIDSANELSEGDAALIGRMFLTAVRLAGDHRIAENGYRLILNTGRDGGQTVPHLHLHLLGGQRIHLGLNH